MGRPVDDAQRSSHRKNQLPQEPVVALRSSEAMTEPQSSILANPQTLRSNATRAPRNCRCDVVRRSHRSPRAGADAGCGAKSPGRPAHTLRRPLRWRRSTSESRSPTRKPRQHRCVERANTYRPRRRGSLGRPRRRRCRLGRVYDQRGGASKRSRRDLSSPAPDLGRRRRRTGRSLRGDRTV